MSTPTLLAGLFGVGVEPPVEVVWGVVGCGIDVVEGVGNSGGLGFLVAGRILRTVLSLVLDYRLRLLNWELLIPMELQRPYRVLPNSLVVGTAELLLRLFEVEGLLLNLPDLYKLGTQLSLHSLLVQERQRSAASKYLFR